MTTAFDYIEEARIFNRAAHYLLKIEYRNASPSEAKISIGLSLHAAELAGKSMLVALGTPPETVAKDHKKHRLIDLLEACEEAIEGCPNVTANRNFMEQRVTIQGSTFKNTIASYLAEHFSRGQPAYARNYFYPDLQTFTFPSPIQATHALAEQLILIAEEVASCAAS